MSRITTNRCRCKKPLTRRLDDAFKSDLCDRCFEIVSYEISQEEVVKKSSAKKIQKPKQDLLHDLKDIEINNVYNCDVFDLIPKIPNNSIRLVHTDPPYGDDSGYGRGNKQILNNEDYSINIKFLDAIYDKMSEDSTIYLYSNHKYYEEIKKHAISIGLEYRMLIIIVKNNIGMGHPFRNQYEVCLVFDKGNPEYYTKDFSNVIKMNHIQHTKESHPHQKDDVLVRKIILHSSQEGDFVFDGFMGSFQTAISCIKENRQFLGSELGVEWYEAGIKRMNNERNKTKIQLKKKVEQEQLKLL